MFRAGTTAATIVVVLIVGGIGFGVVYWTVFMWEILPGEILPWAVAGTLLTVVSSVISFSAWWRRRPSDPWEREAYGRNWDDRSP